MKLDLETYLDNDPMHRFSGLPEFYRETNRLWNHYRQTFDNDEICALLATILDWLDEDDEV